MIKIEINGTIVNYFFHCKRQCYLFGNRLNLEDNSEMVKIGKVIHEERAGNADNTEIAIDNIRLDKITREYLTEIKKSDADVEACKWQLIYYLMILKRKGIIRKGKLEFIEKNKTSKKIEYIELTEKIEKQMQLYEKEILNLIEGEKVPAVINKAKCKKCAYYEYCYM